MCDGDLAGLVAVPCKNDPTGSAFMPHPLYFRFRRADQFCTALLLRDMVVNCWVEPAAMRTTPLFSTSPNGDPFRHGIVDKVLMALLLSFLDEDEAKKYSWHSWRIGLACALLAANAPESIILALCRWKGPQSLRIYARLNMEDVATWVDSAADQVVNSVQAPNLPSLGRTSGTVQALPAAAVAPQAPNPAPTAGPGPDAWPAEASTVPGALSPANYALLSMLEHANPNELSAAQLLSLVGQAPGIDGDAWILSARREAAQQRRPPAGDSSSDDDSDGDV